MTERPQPISPDKAAERIRSQIRICREDIARAKTRILKMANGNVEANATEWLADQQLELPREIDLEQTGVDEKLFTIAQTIGLKQSFFQAAIELSCNGCIVLLGGVSQRDVRINYRTRGYSGGLPHIFTLTVPDKIVALDTAESFAADVDVFLNGSGCNQMHDGIIEAITSSLDCFRKGLYMPSTVMLAAAAEATWTECGAAVAKNLQDRKLEALFADQYSSISKKVLELRKVLESPNAKPLLKSASQSIAKVLDAEVWTTVLRDRRNALHWGKAKSFIAGHSETAVLLMAAPMHLGILESIRLVC
jgi:hypothetical protein